MKLDKYKKRAEEMEKKREEASKIEQKKKTRNKIIFSVIGILVLWGVYSLYSNAVEPGEYGDFAKCLTENNVIMAGTDWCPHCQRQKAMFGKSFKHVEYHNCDKEKDFCDSNGVTGYPTWITGTGKHPGVQSLQSLAALSGCSL